MLLTEQDMIDLTGVKRASSQLAVLKKSSIRFILDHNGHPKTTWEAVNNALNPTGNDNINWDAPCLDSAAS